MKTILALLFTLLLSGCARDNSDKLALLTAYNQGLVACKGEIGCITATQAALYSGAFQSRDDSTVGIIAAALPWGRLVLEGFHLFYGGGGDGQGIIVRGDGNNFFGFNKSVADNNSSVDSSFSATSSLTDTRTFSDMNNVDRSTNQ